MAIERKIHLESDQINELSAAFIASFKRFVQTKDSSESMRFLLTTGLIGNDVTFHLSSRFFPANFRDKDLTDLDEDALKSLEQTERDSSTIGMRLRESGYIQKMKAMKKLDELLLKAFPDNPSQNNAFIRDFVYIYIDSSLPTEVLLHLESEQSAITEASEGRINIVWSQIEVLLGNFLAILANQGVNPKREFTLEMIIPLFIQQLEGELHAITRPAIQVQGLIKIPVVEETRPNRNNFWKTLRQLLSF